MKRGDKLKIEEMGKYFEKGYKDMPYFVDNIFSQSFYNFKHGEKINTFIRGQHVENTAKFLGENNNTMSVSAREHFKSTGIYAHFMYDLLYNPGLECQYFSYNSTMASYHGGKIKQLIRKNPFYENCIDLKPTAEGILKYAWTDKRNEVTTLTPNGLLGFKRGVHCPRIYVDDPFQDPDNKLNPTIINKINRIFITEILSMPTADGEMHVVGTPQTTFDFFFNERVKKGMATRVQPAVQDWVQHKVLWPESWPWERLMARKYKIGDRVFNQEFMCTPVWTEQAWFTRDKLMGAVNPELLPKKEVLSNNYVVLGWDVGKKVHPSHIAIFEEWPPGHWVQVYEKFLDGMGYNDQRLFVNELVRLFRVDKGIYDATRGEMESFVERGELSPVLHPMIFKTTNKHDMATNFEKMVENNETELLNHRRMLDQILVVDNDLQALETPEGHGDSFWSIAMGLWCAGQKVDSWDEPIY